MKNISKVIVFSANEHLSVATAIKTNLDRHHIDVRIWDEMIFQLSILAYDDQPQTEVLYDALINSLQLGSGEDKRKEAKKLREYIASLHQRNSSFSEGIQLRFIRNDLLLYNMWKSLQEDGSQVAHLTMYFHGRDAPSIRVTGKDATLFETVAREFEQLWKTAAKIIE